MNKLVLIFSICFLSAGLPNLYSGDWPFLKHYDQDHTGKIALPVGGIGTGTVSMGGRGNLMDWEIMNRPAKGYNPQSGRQNAGEKQTFEIKL